MTDDFRTGADWGSLIEGYEDQQDQPDPSSMAAPAVSQMLGILRRLYARLGEYEVMHLAEIRRLDERREALVGPLVKRVQQLEASLRQYALRSFLDFGKTGTIIATPNGVIRASRDLVPEIDVDINVADLPEHLIDRKPVAHMAMLRQWLAVLEDSGEFRRFVVRDSDDARVEVAAGAVYRRPLEPGELGVWIDKQENIMPGLSWKPSGDEGSGRTFTIVAV